MAEVQVDQLVAIEDLLDLVVIQVETLKVVEVADLDGDVGDMVVTQLKAGELVQVLEADDHLSGLEVVLEVNILQVVEAEDGVRNTLQGQQISSSPVRSTISSGC